MDRGSRTDVPPSTWITERGGALSAEGCDFEALAARHGTPLHVISSRAVREAFAAVDAALEGLPHLVCYAMKANGNPAILRLLGGLGAGIDAVSGGEVFWALRAGVDPERLVMSGVGKTDEEIALAIDARIRSIHVESASELDVIEALAAERAGGRPVRVGLRINPDVDPKTHPYIATGIHGTKFGLELDVAHQLADRIAASAHLTLEAVTSHIGSQLGDLGALTESVDITARFFARCRDRGLTPSMLDVGGGWPIAYGDEDAPYPSYAAIGEAIRRGLGLAGLLRDGRLAPGVLLTVEPGRALVGDAGALLTRVLHVKSQSGKRFVVCDAAMTELIRPALYGAYHAIAPVRGAGRAAVSVAEIVGPVCESGDFLAESRPLADVRRGELLLVRGTGAYGAAMSSEYNARPRAAEVLVDADRHTLIRRRGTWEALHEEGPGLGALPEP
ncbi:MAG: diaminopimelate decarboxylase [Deltaproteobacteria bacterium]